MALFHSQTRRHVINVYRILGECLLISSLPDKATGSHVEVRGLPRGSTGVLEAGPGKHGKLYIKIRQPVYLFVHSLN